MSKYAQKPTFPFTSNAPLKTGLTPDSPLVIATEVTTSSGPGAVPLTGNIHQITTTATGNALTLAAGYEGQELTLVYAAEAAGADTAILTPAVRAGYSTITFNAIGDTATLLFTSARWFILATRGVTVA